MASEAFIFVDGASQRNCDVLFQESYFSRSSKPECILIDSLSDLYVSMDCESSVVDTVHQLRSSVELKMVCKDIFICKYSFSLHAYPLRLMVNVIIGARISMIKFCYIGSTCLFCVA